MMPGRRRAPGLRRTSVPNAYPRDVPEPPSTASDRHQQQPMNMMLAQALKPRATHGNMLVMRGSLDGGEDQAAACPSRGRSDGYSRNLAVNHGRMDRRGPAIGQVTDQA